LRVWLLSRFESVGGYDLALCKGFIEKIIPIHVCMGLFPTHDSVERDLFSKNVEKVRKDKRKSVQNRENGVQKKQ
jgi:hypothetical protein